MADNKLSPSERAERAETRLARKRAEEKAAKMRVTEAGGFAVATLASGFLQTKFPIAAFNGAIKWDYLFLGTGAVLLLASKGMTQEFGSGMVYGGGAALLRGFGETLATKV